MRIAYVSLSGRGANDAFLTSVAMQLDAEGLRLAGTVQSNFERSDRDHCDMHIHVLPKGPVFAISQDRGAHAQGCRLDAGALEEAAMAVSGTLHEAQLLIVNKFGKQEAEGRGLTPVIAEAAEMGLAILIGVNGMNLPAFRAFAGAMAVELPPDAMSVLNWCKSNVDEIAA
ncbi:DUF2478 domain-containing protein [Paracoccus sp. MBLB3053]|uniref:DUF2478 domain-containing protein n=1 Tax=Paracoccus aurantius TaxID=3073814 RepID=A0ABU2HY44_9RHOB|nr:DUF2478 domain-containing protein [Paracoccus sp. MBLB3053]MDS9469509.1 DUF2478 domain-containing protein [Paracoccus sp. MBLB3053]